MVIRDVEEHLLIHAKHHITAAQSSLMSAEHYLRLHAHKFTSLKETLIFVKAKIDELSAEVDHINDALKEEAPDERTKKTGKRE